MLETETVLDRRRLRRSVSFWRAAGVAGLALAVGALTMGGDKLATLSGQKQIARIAIEGTIGEDREQLKMLKEIAKADHVSGVILYVNSPGGTTTGGEDEAVTWLKDVKKVDADAKVVDWKPESASSMFGFKSMAARAAGLVFGAEAGQLAGALFRDRSISTLGLDGLLSVWHPSEK